MALIPPALNDALGVALDVLRRAPFGPRLVTSTFVSVLANATEPRPRPLTLAGDYTSWISLTDRSFSGRHLPPAPDRPLPTEAQVLELFRRPPGRERPSVDTSVMVLLFAQWFTDSFLRTDRSDWRNRLPPDLRDLGVTDPDAALDGGRPAEVAADRRPGVPAVPARADAERGVCGQAGVQGPARRGVRPRQPAGRRRGPAEGSVFAVGLEHGNSTIGSTGLDVLMVREHNRIAGLAREYRQGKTQPAWEPGMPADQLDERLFQTTRLIMIVLLPKLVVEEYIRHISPHDPPLQVRPGMAHGKKWNR